MENAEFIEEWENDVKDVRKITTIFQKISNKINFCFWKWEKCYDLEEACYALALKNNGFITSKFNIYRFEYFKNDVWYSTFEYFYIKDEFYDELFFNVDKYVSNETFINGLFSKYRLIKL